MKINIAILQQQSRRIIISFLLPMRFYCNNDKKKNQILLEENIILLSYNNQLIFINSPIIFINTQTFFRALQVYITSLL